MVHAQENLSTSIKLDSLSCEIVRLDIGKKAYTKIMPQSLTCATKQKSSGYTESREPSASGKIACEHHLCSTQMFRLHKCMRSLPKVKLPLHFEMCAFRYKWASRQYMLLGAAIRLWRCEVGTSRAGRSVVDAIYSTVLLNFDGLRRLWQARKVVV